MINNLGSKRTLHFQKALAGMVSAALAIAFGELVASITSKTTSLILAVGELIVDITPGDVVRTSIETLGNSQKVVLLTVITILSILFGGFLRSFFIDICIYLSFVSQVFFVAFRMISYPVYAKTATTAQRRELVMKSYDLLKDGKQQQLLFK